MTAMGIQYKTQAPNTVGIEETSLTEKSLRKETQSSEFANKIIVSVPYTIDKPPNLATRNLGMFLHDDV